jgi:trigger factor
MKVDVQKLSPVEVIVAVEIPAEDVDAALDKQYREISKNIQIRGFRKGKAPRKMLEARFGKEVAADTARDLITSKLEEAMKDVDSNAVGEPVLENDPVVAGQPLRFSVRLELRPEFEPQGYRELVLPPVDDSVSDDEIDARLRDRQQREAALLPADDGAKADTGNVLVVDFLGTIDGEPFRGGKGEDAHVELGSGRMIPGFEDELVGAAEGETREFDVTFPADYPAEHLAGRPAHFSVTVKEIKRKELPALDDEFAKDQGAPDLAALRAQLRDEIANEKRHAARDARDEALVTQLIEKHPFDLPPRLLESRTQARMRDLAHRLEHAGHDHEQAHRVVDAQAEAFRKAAERELREYFILRAVAEREGMVATDADVEAYVEHLAAATRMPLQRLRARFDDEETRAGLKVELLERKVKEAIGTWCGAPGEAAAEAALAAAAAPAEEQPAEAPAGEAPASEGAAQEPVEAPQPTEAS